MGKPRFQFLAPDVRGSSGGVAVLYHCVDILGAHGAEASVVHQTRRGGYWNASTSGKTVYSYRLRIASLKRAGSLRAFRHGGRLLSDWIKGGGNDPAVFRDSDILIVPEFLLSLAQEAFPNYRKVVFVQNSFSYLKAVDDAQQRGLDPHKGVTLSIGISETCMDALELVGAAPVAHVPVGADFDRFTFAEEKQAQMAFMPRKRRAEARLVAEALERRGQLQGVKLIELDNMSQEEVARRMAQSMFFLSFLKHEALGFPAMEAMASGCVVVGYTGGGCREYFDEDTGIPVEEDNTAALVRAAEDAIAVYRRDVHAFDDMRRRAADRVMSRYGKKRTADALVAALRGVDLLPRACADRPLQEAS